MQYKEKLMNQIWENGKISNFGPSFAQIWTPKTFLWNLLLLEVRNCCKLSLCSISGKTNAPNLRKQKKPSFGPDFDQFCPKFGPTIFFSKIRLGQALDIIVSYHYVQHQKNPMIQSWENLVTGGQTDRREWFRALSQ